MAERLLRIGVLASGNGSTVEAVQDHIKVGTLPDTEIAFIICNNGPDDPNAGVWQRAKRLGIDIFHISNLTQKTCTVPVVGLKEAKGTISYEASERIVQLADNQGAHMLVGLGYMKRVIGRALEDLDIANLHPGPLPQTAGKYGPGVQEEIMKRGMKYSGPTFHWMDKEVDENGLPRYDSGEIIGHEPVEVTHEMRLEWAMSGKVRLLKAEVMDREKKHIGQWISDAGRQLAA